MHCPYCQHSDSHVIDSRDVGDGIRRRRKCESCGLRYTTYERLHTTTSQVLKRDERREEFNRDKLFNSIRLACVKRPLPIGAIERLVSNIENRIQKMGRVEIMSSTIGEMVMNQLKKLDRVAYIRFASVYRDFTDLETFKDEVDAILAPPPPRARQSDQLSMFPLVEVVPEVNIRRRGRPKKAEGRPG